MGVGIIAKFEISPVEEYIKLLEQQGDNVQEIINKSIYQGAAIAADEIRKEINNLNVVEKVTQKGVLNWEKKALLKGFGISKLKKSGNVSDVKIGFDGYSDHITKTHRNGVPIPLLARAILKGTSFRSKNDFIKRAVNRVKKKVILKMDETINEELEKEMKKNGK